jgi:signal transduction histidine kinase
MKRENDINESYNINSIRSYTSSIVNLVSQDFLDIDEQTLTSNLSQLDMNCLVSDLSSNILFDNTSFDTVDISHELHQDQAYSSINKDKIKASFLIKDDNDIVGIIIFEIPKEVLNTDTYNVFFLLFSIEGLLLISLVIYFMINYKRIIIDPIDRLDQALLDISKGIYHKLESSDGVLIKSFTYYNIMLEEMENMLSNQADYAKSRKQLIANVSHEIRTPLSYVKMSAEMLSLDETISKKNRKLIDTILNKITSIDAIIEDLFRYSRQDLDKLLVEIKEIYAKDMFDRIFENIKLKDEHKNIKLTIHNDINNVLIEADENRLVQVVSNIVDNAEKHIKHKGYINIKTEIEEDHLMLIIEDSGEGISPKDLPYIFEPFYQGEQDDQTKRKGAGLGLAICDYIIKKHHGQIFVYSKKDEGTKFVIKFQEIK